MSLVNPLDLPAVDEVQVRVRGRWGEVVKVDGAAAQTIADLWRRLPPGEQSRCHLPVYELQFFRDGLLVCSATVCWRCNNVQGTMGLQHIGFEFDGEADTSQQLLAELQRVNPGPQEV